MKSELLKKVYKHTPADVMGYLPDLNVYQPQEQEANYDLLIFAAGFEERVNAFPSLFAEGDLKADKILVGKYETNVEDNDLQFAKIESSLDKIGSKIHYVNADAPDEIIQAILEHTQKWEGEKKVGFDISGASSPFICSIMGSLNEKYSNITLDVFYSTAAGYYEPNKDQQNGEAACALAEEGVSRVEVNPLFKGYALDNRDHMLLAIPNLSSKRMARCISHYSEEFDYFLSKNVVWLLPTTDSHEHLWRYEKTLEEIESLSTHNQSISDSMKKSISTMDYKPTIQTFLELIQEYRQKNLSTVLMGSKLQTIGAAIVLCARAEISNIYARPKNFIPSNYSHGIGEQYTIRFNNFKEIVANVAKCGSLNFRSC